MSSLGSCVRAVGSLRLHPKISGPLLRGVHWIAVCVTDVFAVTLVCFTGCNHITTSPISHGSPLLLFRFSIILGLGSTPRFGGHESPT